MLVSLDGDETKQNFVTVTIILITRIWPAVIAAMPENEIYFRICFLAVHTRTARLSIHTLHDSSTVRHTHAC